MLLFPSTAGRINARMPSSGATPQARVFRKRYPGCRQPVVERLASAFAKRLD
jgi:hypothetical protein